LITKETGKK